jgi:hypothetical protein
MTMLLAPAKKKPEEAPQAEQPADAPAAAEG